MPARRTRRERKSRLQAPLEPRAGPEEGSAPGSVPFSAPGTSPKAWLAEPSRLLPSGSRFAHGEDSGKDLPSAAWTAAGNRVRGVAVGCTIPFQAELLLCRCRPARLWAKTGQGAPSGRRWLPMKLKRFLRDVLANAAGAVLAALALRMIDL